MSIVTSKEIAKAIKLDNYGFIGTFIGWIFMKVLKISTINKIYNQNKHKNDVDFLSEYSSHQKRADFAGFILMNEEDQEVFSFGKYKGKTVEEVFNENPGYHNWIQNADFPLYTKKVLREIKDRMSKPKNKMTDSEKLEALQQKFNLR